MNNELTDKTINNTLESGVYYSVTKDDLLLIFNKEVKNFWNKNTSELSMESVVNIEFYREDEGKVKKVSGVILSGIDSLVYLGEF